MANAVESDRAATQRLGDYLSELFLDRVEVLSFERVAGGWSRQTYRVGLRSPSRGEFTVALRGELEMSLLEDNLDREYQLLSAVNGTAVPVPELYGFEATKSVLGYRFIAMEWVDGIIPSAGRRSALKFIREAAVRGVLGPNWVRDIAALHGIDPERIRAAGLDTDVDADVYLARELARWLPNARDAFRHPSPLLEEACQWLEANRPTPAETVLLHADLRLGNMIVRDDKVVAFLDWELAGLGDWRADIAMVMMPVHAGRVLDRIPPSMNGLMHPAEFIEQYLAITKRQLKIADLVYFLVLHNVRSVSLLSTGIGHLLRGNTSDLGRAWSSFIITGHLDDIDHLLTRGLPW